MLPIPAFDTQCIDPNFLGTKSSESGFCNFQCFRNAAFFVSFDLELVFVLTPSRSQIIFVCSVPTFGSQIFCRGAWLLLPCAIVHLDAQFDHKRFF